MSKKIECNHSAINVEATKLEPVLNVEVRCTQCEGLVPMSHVRSRKWDKVSPTVWVAAPRRRG